MRTNRGEIHLSHDNETPVQFETHHNLTTGSKLYRDFVSGATNLDGFFQHALRQPLDWAAVFEANHPDPTQRNRVADILQAWNTDIDNTHAEVQKNLTHLRSENTFCVISGQQTTIFTGSLYTIYKALTAIALSRLLKQRYPDSNFVPIFWCSADDHDFHETATISFINQKNESINQQYSTDDTELRPAYELPTPGNLTDLIQQFCDEIGDRPFLGEMRNLLTRTLSEARSVAHWFSLLMANLLGPAGLVLVSPSIPELRQLMQPIFKREVEQAGQSTQQVNETGQKLTDLGYHGQVGRRDGALNLFYHNQGKRYRITKVGAAFELDQLGQTWDAEKLLEMVAQAPHKFSPGVVLRPIMQDFLLPTAAYVAGPGEIAYFAQLKPVYEMMNVPMPLILPRSSLTMIEPKVQRLLEKLGISWQQAIEANQNLIRDVMEEHFPNHIDDKFAHLRQAVQTHVDDILPDIEQIEAGTHQFAQKMFGKIDYTINQVRDKTFQAHKKKNQIIRQQIDTVLTHLLPNGKLQERTVHIFQFLAIYGPPLLADLTRFVEKDVAETLNLGK